MSELTYNIITMNNLTSKQFTYVDIRLHPFMYEVHDYSSMADFIHHVILTEGYLLDDVNPRDFYEAFRRQYELIHSVWCDEFTRLLYLEMARFIYRG